MLSACEDCLFLFPAEMTACPNCHQTAAWLCQTYDLDAPVVCVPCGGSTATAVK